MVLDGGSGTMVQCYGLSESDFRGQRFANSKINLKGCNDVLCLTRPDIVEEIHRQYLKAGADIIETNSFNTNAISLSDYGLENNVAEIARAAAEIARKVADEFTVINPDKPRFVAGSVGPTSKTASISADILNPGSREVTFSQLVEAYSTQIEGLMEGGADLILIETVFDTLNAKAALFAADEVMQKRGEKFPVMLSVTISDAAGRTLSGQTIEAFVASVSHAPLISLGLNCGYGSKQMLPYLERLSAATSLPVSVHPNAGLPDELGNYTETPEIFAENIRGYLEKGIVNIVGGCCGTTPAHIQEIDGFTSGYSPRIPNHEKNSLVLSNLEVLEVDKTGELIKIGERNNVAGSAKFARLIRNGEFAEALEIARRQVEAGANAIDVCMDDGLIDGPEAMRNFLNLVAAEPDISRVPVMIDSSNKETIRAGLQVSQGKCIVNSISLKEGEEEFLKFAQEIKRYGAAVVVMLFDEKGQADTFERKIEVAERAYRLLTENGFPAQDIIFDPNILTIGTGIEQHDEYATAFIDATKWIKENLPHAKVSGGVSNLSFAFRGNNEVREAMHSAFLHHARKAGMDMAIVNPSTLKNYEDINPELLVLVEDLIFHRHKDAAVMLADYAEHSKKTDKPGPKKEEDRTSMPLEARISDALIKGSATHMAEDIEAAYQEKKDALRVIDEILMPAMAKIGELFGAGKMFLPQVVKSARVMKEAINVLTPHIDAEKPQGNVGNVVIATVKGDVHDIGKNIVSVVVGCNGFNVTDLGVMVDADTIVKAAIETNAEAVLLSGLITPSLEEMIKVCREMENRGLKIPVIIGGATTSPLHTALKIAPVYSGPVIHAADASANSRILMQLISERREEFILQTRAAQAKLREGYVRRKAAEQLAPLADARKFATRKKEPSRQPNSTETVVFENYDIDKVIPFINYDFFFSSWGLPGRYPEILDNPKYGKEARKLLDDAREMLEDIRKNNILRLQGVVKILPARADGDDVVLTDSETTYRLPMLRSRDSGNGYKCVADFVAENNDHICLFALTAGIGLDEYAKSFRAQNDEYRAIMAKLLADRLTEAFAECVHLYVRQNLWGFEGISKPQPNEVLKGNYEGCRLAFGYPAVPDHTLKRDVFKILNVEGLTGMRLTENAMIIPGEALCGIILPYGNFFSVGTIGKDLLEDYAARRNITVEAAASLLPQNI